MRLVWTPAILVEALSKQVPRARDTMVVWPKLMVYPFLFNGLINGSEELGQT